MIQDALAGKIDMILTKSVSRFARNTVDSLVTIRKLKEKNVAVVFEKEGINTLEGTGEILITILSSLAQEESRNISENIRWGVVRKFEKGKVIVNCTKFMGYTKNEDGDLVIVPEEAEIVKLIFRLYLEGYSTGKIAKHLEEQGIKTATGQDKWHSTVIDKMLRNEKYMGDALLQKTITTDYIEKIRIKNDGTVPQYYVKDSQEPIIARDIFAQVQEEMIRRANLTSGKDGKKKRIYSSKYALSNICTCTKCGDIYRRIVWNNRGKKSTVWRCCTRVENGPFACDASTVQESELQNATVKAINQLLSCSDRMMRILKDNIETALADDNSDEIEKVNVILKKKQKELVKLAHAKKDYTALVDEIDNLREEKQKLLVQRAETEGVKKRIAELTDFLQDADQELSEYDEGMVRKYIEQIKVYEGKFTVCFKAKVEINIER